MGNQSITVFYGFILCTLFAFTFRPSQVLTKSNGNIDSYSAVPTDKLSNTAQHIVSLKAPVIQKDMELNVADRRRRNRVSHSYSFNGRTYKSRAKMEKNIRKYKKKHKHFTTTTKKHYYTTHHTVYTKAPNKAKRRYRLKHKKIYKFRGTSYYSHAAFSRAKRLYKLKHRKIYKFRGITYYSYASYKRARVLYSRTHTITTIYKFHGVTYRTRAAYNRARNAYRHYKYVFHGKRYRTLAEYNRAKLYYTTQHHYFTFRGVRYKSRGAMHRAARKYRLHQVAVAYKLRKKKQLAEKLQRLADYKKAADLRAKEVKDAADEREAEAKARQIAKYATMAAHRKAKEDAEIERLALYKKKIYEAKEAHMENRQQSLAKIHAELKNDKYHYHGETPKNCMCEIIPLSTNSWCMYLTGVTSSSCEERRCRPGYGCVNRDTGTVCMLRMKKYKVVKVGEGSCTKKYVEEPMYVPYALGYDRYY